VQKFGLEQKTAGYLQTGGGLQHVVVADAGHMAVCSSISKLRNLPCCVLNWCCVSSMISQVMDQPKFTLKMIADFVTKSHA